MRRLRETRLAVIDENTVELGRKGEVELWYREAA
jgi:hypothetical protein